MIRPALAFLFLLTGIATTVAQNNILVFQSDFGLRDGAVSAMKGVAMSVSDDLEIFDVTHEITAYNIEEAAYRLKQVAAYWPKGTVFVSIIDPGVGSQRKSIVLKTKSGHYFVSPDNGTLTLIADALGIEAVRIIDETKNRLKGSEGSYTFHGRDVYAYTGARLAAGVIKFEGVGPLLSDPMVRLPIILPVVSGNEIKGMIPVLDVQYGNVWTNIDAESLKKIGVATGDMLEVKISFDNETKFEGKVLFANTFADVKEGEVLGYLNSLMNFSLAINMGNFASTHAIASGERWTITVRKISGQHR